MREPHIYINNRYMSLVRVSLRGSGSDTNAQRVSRFLEVECSDRVSEEGWQQSGADELQSKELFEPDKTNPRYTNL